jgi:hypothetical protein
VDAREAGLPAGLAERLRAELGCELAAAAPIDPGVIHNNLLWRLDGADGRRLVLKAYFRDDRRRLEREFGAFAFLRERGFGGVPEPLLRDDAGYWAVYSFEPGEVKTAAELTVARPATGSRRRSPRSRSATVSGTCGRGWRPACARPPRRRASTRRWARWSPRSTWRPRSSG